MAIMLAKTYAAFKAAGVSDTEAEAAAEEIAAFDNRLGTIEGDLRLLKWMVGGIYAVLTIIGAPSLWLLLRVAVKLGAVS